MQTRVADGREGTDLVDLKQNPASLLLRFFDIAHLPCRNRTGSKLGIAWEVSAVLKKSTATDFLTSI